MWDAFRKLRPYLWRYRRGLFLGFASLVIKDLFAVAQPLVLKAGIDSLLKGFSVETVLWFCGGLMLLSALKGVFQYHMRLTLVGISRDIEYDLRNVLYARLCSLDGTFYSRYRTGDILA